MRVTLLGTGTCVPSGTRSSSGYFVEAAGVRARLDCGAGTVHAMARHGLPWPAVTHQFISHFHIDHVGELPAFLFALRHGPRPPRTAPLELIGPVGLGALVAALGALYREPFLDDGALGFSVAVRELAPGAACSLSDGATLRVAKTPHNSESLACVIEADGAAVGYTGDTAPSDELARFFAGVDVLLAECSFVDDAEGTAHLRADDLAALATAAGARRLVVTHAYFDPVAERVAERIAKHFTGAIVVGEDGMTFEIGGVR